MKHKEPQKAEIIRKESHSFFLSKASIDEDLDKEDTALTDPESSPYFPADTDPEFSPEDHIKNL